MSAPSPLAARTGLEYDRARWTDWVPDVSHVVRQSGMGTLLQTVPAQISCATETNVPPTDANILLFWTRGQRIHFRVDGTPLTVTPRPWDFTLLPHSASSWWESTPEAAHGVFHIHLDTALFAQVPDRERGAASPMQLPVISRGNDEAVRGLARWLFDALTASARPQSLLWDTAATALALRLAGLGRDPPRSAATSARGLAPWQVRRLTDYLQDHLATEVPLSGLAQLIGLSPSHLCRAFKQSTGAPPHRWQMARRIERAQALLANSNASITDIAAAVGYDDPGQLATAFRKATGLTPSQYRKERRS